LKQKQKYERIRITLKGKAEEFFSQINGTTRSNLINTILNSFIHLKNGNELKKILLFHFSSEEVEELLKILKTNNNSKNNKEDALEKIETKPKKSVFSGVFNNDGWDDEIPKEFMVTI